MDTNLILQEVLNFLKTTGTTLASQGFQIAVRQVYAEIASNFIWAIALFIVFVLLLFLLKKVISMFKVAKEDSYNFDDVGYSLSFAGIGIGLFLSLLFSLMLITEGVMMTINPYWYAIKLILNTVTGNN